VAAAGVHDDTGACPGFDEAVACFAAIDSELEMGHDQIISRQNMLPRIYPIRHGDNEWSLSGKHTGRTNIPLTAHGEHAAPGLGQRLRDILFTRVLTSPRQV
jgi:hypothetical protein